MTFHYDISQIKNVDELWIEVEKENESGIVEKKYQLNPVTETLIFLTTVCGLNQITEKNCKEFYYRVKLLEVVNGGYCLLGKDGKGYPFKFDMIVRHIGLKTNARIRPLASIWNAIKDEVYRRCTKEIKDYYEQKKENEDTVKTIP